MCTFQGDGFIEAAQDNLVEQTLQPKEWAQFSQSVQQLATSRERKAGSFEKFIEFVQRNDHSIFLDAANIAFFNTMKFITENRKYSDERFQWPQVIKVYDLVRQTFPDSRVMVIAHNYRCRSKFVRSHEVREFVDKLQVCYPPNCAIWCFCVALHWHVVYVTMLSRLQSQGDLWVTPNGSNDDWYWLYGVISKGRYGMLVSNDDMRDHIFELLRPRYFIKWRELHRCKYSVSTEEDAIQASLELPPRFSTCVQLLPQSECWMFPGENGMWLCARPKALGS